MDCDAPFPISNGNGNATSNGVDVNNSRTNSPATQSGPEKSSISDPKSKASLPRFETLLFSSSSPVPSYANDPLCGADIDSFLAEQGPEFCQEGNPETSCFKSTAVELKNGTPDKFMLENSSSLVEDVKSPNRTEANKNMSENFMGFQPLDSNGNASDDSPSVTPLKVKTLASNVDRSSGDTSIESESVGNGSESENDYLSAEDRVDSAHAVVEEDGDEEDEGEDTMEVDDVTDAGVDSKTAVVPEKMQTESDTNEDPEVAPDGEQDPVLSVNKSDKNDLKNDSNADKAERKDVNRTVVKVVMKKDGTTCTTTEKKDAEFDADTTGEDAKLSDEEESESKNPLEVEDTMDEDTETEEDDEKLVIDDGDEVKESKSGITDNGNDSENETDRKTPLDKRMLKTSVVGFTSMTPEVPDLKPMCWCGGAETPEMIACDSPRCKLVWYHYSCVKLKPDDIPEGDWYCPTCVGSGFNNKEKPDTARPEKLSADDEESSKSRKRKQTLKARESATDEDFEFEITVNQDDSDDDHGKTKDDDMMDDPLTGGKVLKKPKKSPKTIKVHHVGESDSEGEFEMPSWHANPKELFDGMDRPHGPRAAKLKKPFDHGWAREIVVRFKYESLKGSGRPPMDVYYFTPEGKKLRSIVQIGDYLDKTTENYGLSTDNFSLNRIPVHKEPWENMRMANMGRSAGSVKGASAKRGKMLVGMGRGRTKLTLNRPFGRPPKSFSPKVPCYITQAEEKEEPKTFPEILNLKPVQKVSAPSSTPVGTQKARKSFRPMELPKRLLSPLEQSMPDPKRPKLKTVLGNHIQLHNEGGFRLCSLDCVGQAGRPPTLHCGICMCLFHPQCVQFLGNTTAVFVCERCRKQPKNTMQTSSSIPVPSPDVMLPLTIEKAGRDDEPSSIQSKALTGGSLVPPPPSLKPMTIAAHMKSLQHEQKKQNVVSWSFAEGNLKFTNTMPKPPPLKTVTAPLGQLSSMTMPLLTKPRTIKISPTPVGPTSGSVVRTALSNHLQGTSPSGGNGSPAIMSAPPAIVSAQNANDIRMAGQLLTLPGNIINRIKMNEPLALKINNQSLVVNPDCFVQTSHGVKIFLPPNTLPVQTGNNKTINITVPQTSESPTPATTVSHSTNSTLQASTCTTVVLGEGGIMTKAVEPELTKPAFNSSTLVESLSKSAVAEDSANLHSNISSNLPSQPMPSQPMMVGQGLVPVPQDLPTVLPQRPKRSRRKLQINPSACFIKQLHGGYDSLLQIFSYLSVPDLLKVSQVCRRWKSIVTETWMWRTVRLRGMFVTDWDTAMNFLTKVETKKLDLRGLRHIDDRNRTWHQITGVLDKMIDLNIIHFGQCPASILHAVTDKLTGLKVITAEWITEIFEEPQMWTTNTKLDIAKFSKLPHLEELRLRGVCGLVLPSFSFSGGLEDLSVLEKLKKLSLTTLKEVSGNDFSFIGRLTNLEELEIGDCTFWNEETYSHLSKLENLKILRLENGGDLDDTGLATSLKSLKKLTKLELVMFIIPSELEDALSELVNLQELSVWPDPRDQAAVVNTNTLNAVKNLQHLTKLEWGVVSSQENEEGNREENGNLPFLRKAFMEKMSENMSEKTGSDAESSAMEVDATNEEGKELIQKKKVDRDVEEVITTQTLHDRLSGMLVETKVTINDVAVLSSQKGRSRTKST